MGKILTATEPFLKTLKSVMCIPLSFAINCTGFIGGLVSKEAMPSLIKELCANIKDKQYYYAVYIRPRCYKRNSFIEGLTTPRKIAIILQGPVCTENNMTLDTVKFYKKMYPSSKIIISTWKGTDDNLIQELESYGAMVLQNDEPSESGILNINYQMVSSLAGLQKAKELGYDIAVKTRTDQRFCKNYLFDSIACALDTYKPVSGSGQKSRIALLSTYSSMVTPYFLSDFMYMGNVDDLLSLFSAPLDSRVDTGDQIIKKAGATRREYSRTMYPPEIYLLKHYLNDRLHYKCDDTLENYWNAVKDYFVCYSRKDVDLLWFKHGGYYELNSYYSNFFRNIKLENSMAALGFDFMNWLALYSGIIEYKKDYEKYADMEMRP